MMRDRSTARQKIDERKKRQILLETRLKEVPHLPHQGTAATATTAPKRHFKYTHFSEI